MAALFEKKIFDLLLTGSEIQNGVSSKLLDGISKSYNQNKSKLKSKVYCGMAQAVKEYIVDPRTGSGSNCDFRKSVFFGFARKLRRKSARDFISLWVIELYRPTKLIKFG